jgi:hypothetical protein
MPRNLAMNIAALIAALPLLFQGAVSSTCPVNQYVEPGIALCYEMMPSPQNPAAMDSRVLDLVNQQYLETQWIYTNMMLSKMETATTTFCWYDDEVTSTFPC